MKFEFMKFEVKINPQDFRKWIFTSVMSISILNFHKNWMATIYTHPTDIKECTLRALKEKVGMGSPPKPFYTNDSESLSAVIKEKVDYKKHQWPIFNDKMKQLVDQSQQEVEKAIIGTGRYQMKEQYRHLIVDQKSGFEWQKHNELAICRSSILLPSLLHHLGTLWQF